MEKKIEFEPPKTTGNPLGGGILNPLGGLFRGFKKHQHLDEEQIITENCNVLISYIENLKIADVDEKMIFNQIYKSIPTFVVEDISQKIFEYKKARDNQNNSNYNNDTYEKIMVRYMNYAGVNIPYWVQSVLNIDNPLTNKFFEVVLHRSFKDSPIAIDCFPIKPVVMASIWAFLLFDLSAKYLKETEHNISIIAKLSISLVISSFSGLFGYLHQGGILPGSVPSWTSWLRTIYSGAKWVQNKSPYIFEKFVPELLRKIDEFIFADFNKLSKALQKQTAQVLNMLDTFRVGDTFLENLSSSSYISEDSVINIFKSMLPLPTSYEARKMYLIFTNNKVYNL